ncbi:hypothetical protein V493_05629 [Pseudogymnoascus sp. VKM F-4281 (FW-2241)]|nr:hypothetical protein V493_05629 [Pseudogymnoascus sp. VKM F-4281 (FW-2241)]
MPETQAQSLEVPKRGDPDRKRVLNVLAQRRYRQRRQEKVHALERRSAATEAASTNGIFLINSSVGDPNQHCMDVSMVQGEDNFWPVSDGTSPSSDNTRNSLSSTATSSPDSYLDDPNGLDQLFFDLSQPLYNLNDFDSELQALESSQFTFPDDANLLVPELKVIKAGLEMATLLDCGAALWDPTATRLFTSTTLSITLPPDLQPTEVQGKIPHHPLLDILPWPSVRNKFIYIFSRPVESRPKTAQDPMALIKLQYDLEDSAEGVRILNEDCYSGKNWEIGQVVFQNWWWALDRSVVEHSNRLRARRGAPPLQLTSVVQKVVIDRESDTDYDTK